MKIHVARQPIYDRRLNVFGYELLYRANAASTSFDATRPADQASSSIIIDTFHGFGIENLVGGKKAFINFTGNLIKQKVATLFPAERLVVEVLETVEPDEAIVDACKAMSEKGYLIALDDFVLSPKFFPLLEIANIIKVDFRTTAPAVIKSLIEQLHPKGIDFLAEKIETQQEFQLAMALGFTYFQGYFLSKPVLVSGERLKPLPANYLRLLNIVCQRDFDLAEVSGVIRQDISLSYDLLRLANSVAFGFRYRTASVHQAIVALGVNEARKWVSLVVMTGLNRDAPNELISASLIRARMLQNIAMLARKPKMADSMFLAGLFSLIDAIAERPIEEVIADLPMHDDVRDVLLNHAGPLAPYLALVIHQERGEWNDVFTDCDRLRLKSEAVQDQYNEATRWSMLIFEAPRS